MKTVLIVGGIALLVLFLIPKSSGTSSPAAFGLGMYGGFDSEGKWLR